MRHKIVLRGVLISLAGLLAACAIHKDVSYFSPVLRQDVQVTSTFRGLGEIVNMRVNDKVELRLVMFDEPSRSSLKVLVYLPSGQSVRFETPEIVAIPSTGEPVIVARIDSIRANYIENGHGSPRYLKTVDELEGASHQYKTAFGGVATMPRLFEIETEFPVRLPDHFQIRFPSMMAAGKLVSFPELEFTRKTGSAYQGSPP